MFVRFLLFICNSYGSMFWLFCSLFWWLKLSSKMFLLLEFLQFLVCNNECLCRWWHHFLDQPWIFPKLIWTEYCPELEVQRRSFVFLAWCLVADLSVLEKQMCLIVVMWRCLTPVHCHLSMMYFVPHIKVSSWFELPSSVAHCFLDLSTHTSSKLVICCPCTT